MKSGLAYLLFFAASLAVMGVATATYLDDDYEKCKNLNYCWDQRGIEGCGWCYDPYHPKLGYGIPCKKVNHGKDCIPIKPCKSGKYFWKDSNLHLYGRECTHKCWNIHSCKAQKGIDSCGWCQPKIGQGYGIPCLKSHGKCTPVQHCDGAYVWNDKTLRKTGFCY